MYGLASNHRITVPFLFLVLLLIIGTPSYTPAAENGRVGGVIIVQEERLKKPFTLSSCRVLLDGKTILEKKAGDKGLGDITINRLPEGKHKIRLCEICSELKVEFVKTSTGYGFVKQKFI